MHKRVIPQRREKRETSLFLSFTLFLAAFSLPLFCFGFLSFFFLISNCVRVIYFFQHFGFNSSDMSLQVQFWPLHNRFMLFHVSTSLIRVWNLTNKSVMTTFFFILLCFFMFCHKHFSVNTFTATDFFSFFFFTPLYFKPEHEA